MSCKKLFHRKCLRPNYFTVQTSRADPRSWVSYVCVTENIMGSSILSGLKIANPIRQSRARFREIRQRQIIGNSGIAQEEKVQICSLFTENPLASATHNQCPLGAASADGTRRTDRQTDGRVRWKKSTPCSGRNTTARRNAKAILQMSPDIIGRLNPS